MARRLVIGRGKGGGLRRSVGSLAARCGREVGPSGCASRIAHCLVAFRRITTSSRVQRLLGPRRTTNSRSVRRNALNTLTRKADSAGLIGSLILFSNQGAGRPITEHSKAARCRTLIFRKRTSTPQNRIAKRSGDPGSHRSMPSTDSFPCGFRPWHVRLTRASGLCRIGPPFALIPFLRIGPVR